MTEVKQLTLQDLDVDALNRLEPFADQMILAWNRAFGDAFQTGTVLVEESSVIEEIIGYRTVELIKQQIEEAKKEEGSV